MNVDTRVVAGRLQQPWAWLALALAAMVAGFWPSFFARLDETDLPHLLHGVTATLWMTIAVLQAWLIRRRAVGTHRKLGRWLLVLPPIIVASGLQMIAMMLTESANPPLVSFKFAYLDTLGLVLFLAGIALAVRHARRHEVALHQRWMTCTVLLALEPALERLYLTLVPRLVRDFDDALYVALFTVEAILVVLVLRDWRTGRFSAPYPVLLAFFVIIHLTATTVASNPDFQALALRLAGGVG